MRAGVSDRPCGWRDLLAPRWFPRPTLLPGPWWSYYWHEVKTAILGDRQVAHRLKYAY